MKALILSIGVLLACNAFAQTKSPILGEWEGESICQVPKPCTTEHVIYEIKAADGANKFTIKADKVVNGQREWMGDINCTSNDHEQKLNCPMEGRRPGDWVFSLKGDTLLGTLAVREGNVLYRKISVKRKAT